MRDVPWEHIFKFSASAAASEFCEWVQVAIDVYIPHRKYQVKPHSCPWFLAACAAAKRVLEAAKVAYANKTKESITFQKLGSRVFWRIANSVLSKGKSAIPAICNGLEALPSAPDKAKLFAENFSNNSNLDDSGISLLVFPSRTNSKMHNISVTSQDG